MAIKVNARPLPSFDTRDHQQVRFGSLQFRSGLVLTSSFPGFGGLSSLRLDARGERFIALSDQGSWFTGRIRYRDQDGIQQITGLDEVEAAPMLGPDGQPITRAAGSIRNRSHSTARPSMSASSASTRCCGSIFSQGFTRARGEVFPMPAAVRRLPNNKGAGDAGVRPKGPAACRHADRDLRARPRCGRQSGRVSGRRRDAGPVQRSSQRQIRHQRRGAAAHRALLVLERKFSLLDGVGIRIRVSR